MSEAVGESPVAVSNDAVPQHSEEGVSNSGEIITESPQRPVELSSSSEKSDGDEQVEAALQDALQTDSEKESLPESKSSESVSESASNEKILQYTIGPTDTVTSIATRYDTTPSVLRTLNKRNFNMVFAGDVIKVPNPDYIPPKETKPDPAPSWVVLDDECVERFVKIKVSFLKKCGTAEGILLLTPTAVMFEPLVSAESFSEVIAIESIVSTRCCHETPGVSPAGPAIPRHCVSEAVTSHTLLYLEKQQSEDSVFSAGTEQTILLIFYDNVDLQHHFRIPAKASKNIRRFFCHLHETGETERHFVPSSKATHEEDDSTTWDLTSVSEQDELTVSAEASGDAADPDLCVPALRHSSTLLTDTRLRHLAKLVPSIAIGSPWSLVYSTDRNGFSLSTLYRCSLAFADSPTLLAMMDNSGQVFGALLSCAPKVAEAFYGSGMCCLFTFYPSFRVFRWTTENILFVKGEADSLAVGAGDGKFGIWLDHDLYRGRTEPSKTFSNTPLTSDRDFTVANLELWALIDF